MPKFASATLQTRLFTEQVRLTILSAPLSLLSAPILASIAAGLLWSRTSAHGWLIAWWILLLAAYAARFVMRLQFVRLPPSDPAGFARLRPRVIAMAFLTGATWGVVPFFPLTGDSFINTAILAFLIAGVTSSGITTLAADRTVALAFVTPCLAPLTLLLLIDQNGIAKGLSLMVMLHFIVAVIAIRQIHSNLADNIRLRLESEAQQAQVAASEARIRDHEALNSVIAAAQNNFIRDVDLRTLFEEVLSSVLPITGSTYGFIGEVVYDQSGKPFLKTQAITDISWDEETHRTSREQVAAGKQFRNLDALFDTTIQARSVVIVNSSLDPPASVSTLDQPAVSAFLGAPIQLGNELLGMIGIANRAGGYAAELGEYLRPLLTSMAQIIDARRSDAARLSAEQHVVSMHAQLSAFVDHTPAAVAMFDRELRFLAFSQRWRHDFHIADEQLIGKPLFAVLPDLPDLWRESYQRALQGSVESEEADPYIRSDGSVRWLRWEARPWLESDGAIAGIILYCEDVTDAKRAADGLHARDQLLAKLSARIPGMLFQTRYQKADDRTSLLYASEGAREIYDRSVDELADDAAFILSVCHPDDKPLLTNAIARAVHDGGVLSIENRICVANKPVRWMHTEATIERLADASIVWHGYVQDITERKQNETRLAELTERLTLAAHAHGLGVWHWDLAANTMGWDQRMCAIFDTSFVDNQSTWEIWRARVHPDDKQRVSDEITALKLAAQENADTFATEFRILLHNGHERRIRCVGAVGRNQMGVAIRIVGTNAEIAADNPRANLALQHFEILRRVVRND